MKETKAPSGYNLSLDVYEVTVDTNRYITVKKGGADYTDGYGYSGDPPGPPPTKITVDTSVPIISHNDNDLIIYKDKNGNPIPYSVDPNTNQPYTGKGIHDAFNHESFNFGLKFTGEHVKEGDKLTVHFDPTWNLSAVQIDWQPPVIYNQNKTKVLANPSLNKSTNELTYTFTQAVEDYPAFTANVAALGTFQPDYRTYPNINLANPNPSLHTQPIVFTDRVTATKADGTTNILTRPVEQDTQVRINYGTYYDGYANYRRDPYKNLSNTNFWDETSAMEIIEDNGVFYQRAFKFFNINARTNFNTSSIIMNIPNEVTASKIFVYRVTPPAGGDNRAFMPLSKVFDPNLDPTNYKLLHSETGLGASDVTSSAKDTTITYKPGTNYIFENKSGGKYQGPIRVDFPTMGNIGYGYIVEVHYKITDITTYAQKQTPEGTPKEPVWYRGGALANIRSERTQEKYLGRNESSSIGIDIPEVITTPLSMTVSNQKYMAGQLKLKKVDSATTSLGIENAYFTLAKTDGSYTKTETSNQEGYVSFTDLAPGTYTLRELKAPDGYEPVTTVWTVEVQNLENEQEATVIVKDGSGTVVNPLGSTEDYYQMTNVKKKANFEFTKTDATTGNALPGVKFSLTGYDQAQNKLIKHEALSDAQGKVSFTNLPVDSYYYMREESTVEGYSLPNHIWILAVLIDNSRPEGYRIELYKTQEAIPSVSFAPHPSLTGAWARKNETTNKYVDVQTGQDIDAVTGATINPNDLNEFGSWTGLEGPLAGDLTITNKKAGLIIYKKAQNNEPLNGAVFTLTPIDPVGTPLVESSLDGQVSFENLADGTYELTETQPPQGYTGTTDKWQVTVSGGNVVVEKFLPPTYTANLAAPTNDQSVTSTASHSGHYYPVDISTKFTAVDTAAKTFQYQIEFNKIFVQSSKGSTRGTKLVLTPSNLNIENVTSTHSGFAYNSGTKTITIGDDNTTNTSKVTITVTGSYLNQEDIGMTLNHTGTGLKYANNNWEWTCTDCIKGNLTSTVPITASGSGGGVELVPGNGNFANAKQIASPYTDTGLEVGTKITKINRQTGDFEALVYFNSATSLKKFYYVTLKIDGGTGNSIISSIDTVKRYTSNSYAAMPRDFNIDLDNSAYTLDKTDSFINVKSVNLTLPGTSYQTINNRYVFLVTGKYDKDVTGDLKLATSFTNGVVDKSTGDWYNSQANVPAYSVNSSPWTAPGPATGPDPSIGQTADGTPTVTVTNTKKIPKGKLTLEKVNPAGSPLNNVEFQLRGPVTDTDPGTIRTETTNANGQIIFDNLSEGTYFLTETSTPDGYISNTTVWTVVVDGDGNTFITTGPGQEPGQATPGDSNITFPTKNGSLNILTQVSSPSDSQLQTPYPSYSNPIDYTLSGTTDGQYATDFDQTVESLRNVWLTDAGKNYGGYLTYQGNYETKFGNQKWKTSDFAHTAKYAEKTNAADDNDHNYDVTLKVKGNTFHEETQDKLGVIILYDNSKSMDKVVGNSRRVTLAKIATTNFVNTLSQKLPNTEFALITYGSTIFDGAYRTTNYQGKQYSSYTPNYSQLSFTSNPATITNKLPSQTPSAYPNTNPLYYFGGTYSPGAFVAAQSLLDEAQARTENKFDRLVVVNVTDGVPTLSPLITGVSGDETTFNSAPSALKGDGQWYYLNFFNNYNYHKAYNVTGLGNVNSHGIPMERASQNLKNDGVEVFNIGIAVKGDTEVPQSVATSLMLNVSSGQGYNYPVEEADTLPNAFNSIINSIYKKTIVNGVVTDTMGEKVDLVLNGPFSSDDYTLTATRNGQPAPDLLTGVTPVYDTATRTISLPGLNLGLGEEIILKYKVRLRTEGPNAAEDNVYYFTNGETTLEPNPAQAAGVKWNFPVPSVKKIGEAPPQAGSLQVTNYLKPNIGFIKIRQGDQTRTLEGAVFQLYKMNGTDRVAVGDPVTPPANGQISFTALEPGNYELVETQAPTGYEKLADPAVTFIVTDQGQIVDVTGVLADSVTGPVKSTDPAGYYYIENVQLRDMNFEIKKLDGAGNPITSGTVKFSLTRDPMNPTGGQVPTELQSISVDLTNPSTAVVSVPLSMNGIYILEETQAPEGYIKSTDKYYININQADRTMKLIKVTNDLGIEKDYQGGTLPITLYAESSPGVQDTVASLKLGIVNLQPNYPNTGGKGIRTFVLVGSAMMVIGAYLYLRQRRKMQGTSEVNCFAIVCKWTWRPLL